MFDVRFGFVLSCYSDKLGLTTARHFYDEIGRTLTFPKVVVLLQYAIQDSVL